MAVRLTLFIAILIQGGWAAGADDPGLPARMPSEKLDQRVAEAWTAQSISPAPLAGDVVFLRRVWLDLAGQTPPVERIREFVADRSAGKRAALVDELLASDLFADHWGAVVAHWLLGRRPRYEERYDGRVLQHWLRRELNANRAYDAVARELLCGEGAKDRSGPANFLLRYEARPTELAGAVARELLGLSLQCAQCHDHPTARWTQADFWGMAACFGRLHVLAGDANGQPLTAVYETRRGELERPNEQAPLDENGQRPQLRVAPRLLDGTAARSASRRRDLAEWLTAADHPYFARQTANRVWEQLFGKPLVRSLDGWDASAPHDFQQRILDQLADDFRASGYDLKVLVRLIVLSRPYQLAAGDGAASPTPGGAAILPADSAAARAARQARLDWFALFPVRPVDVDVLYRSMVRATGYVGHDDPPDASGQQGSPADLAAGLAAMPLVSDVAKTAGGANPPAAPAADPTRRRAMRDRNSMQPPPDAASDEALELDAGDADDELVQAEPNDWPAELLGERGLTVQRSLALLNSDYVREAVRSGARIAQATQTGRSSDGPLEWMFLATLSRLPTAEELSTMRALRKGRGAAGLEDVLWALLNSAEFTTNH